MSEMRPIKKAIGRLENGTEVTSKLADSVERNSSYLKKSQMEQSSGHDQQARSLLRQRSLKSMLKNNSKLQERASGSIVNTALRRDSASGKIGNMMQSSSSVLCIDSPINLSPVNDRSKANSVLGINYLDTLMPLNGGSILNDDADQNIFSATVDNSQEVIIGERKNSHHAVNPAHNINSQSDGLLYSGMP